MGNECFEDADLSTRGRSSLRANVRTSLGRKPIMFQITYAPKVANARTQILRLHGHIEVITVIGNEAAKVVLSMHHRD